MSQAAADWSALSMARSLLQAWVTPLLKQEDHKQKRPRKESESLNYFLWFSFDDDFQQVSYLRRIARTTGQFVVLAQADVKIFALLRVNRFRISQQDDGVSRVSAVESFALTRSMMELDMVESQQVVVELSHK